MPEGSLKNLKVNWKQYEKLCKRLCDAGLNELLDNLGQRLVPCPASPRTEQIGCYPGGLIEHALEVTAVMRTLADAYGFSVPIASILRVGLLHEIGKVGDTELDYFTDQDSDWHREKLGQLYKYNEDLSKMSVSHRTLYLLQHFRVQLSKDEWVAIQLAGGSHFEENRFYVGHEPSLALLLQQAKQAVIHRSKTS
ncbi:MAG: hypothetical protein CMB80_09325 [Flammeovirgaceae bacterium]|nr:hypothetical protein [Flammeovirgaceae bacterium]